ncbi:hypothetical protein CRG98_031311 [Punica granatum]|uniref:Uncharacterized protein n=1 Tax=Punica granatum TaxID=22663 RepID=A0A2I0IWA6_PUNGR|nr:hypothetical protein CRG98_031311 [Punica granatum]
MRSSVRLDTGPCAQTPARRTPLLLRRTLEARAHAMYRAPVYLRVRPSARVYAHLPVRLPALRSLASPCSNAHARAPACPPVLQRARPRSRPCSSAPARAPACPCARLTVL